MFAFPHVLGNIKSAPPPHPSPFPFILPFQRLMVMAALTFLFVTVITLLHRVVLHRAYSSPSPVCCIIHDSSKRVVAVVFSWFYFVISMVFNSCLQLLLYFVFFRCLCFEILCILDNSLPIISWQSFSCNFLLFCFLFDVETFNLKFKVTNVMASVF